MTDDERREWLASLRPGDRVAFDSSMGWLRGCWLEHRLSWYGSRPDEGGWQVCPDSIEHDEPSIHVGESALRPLPYPEWAGILIELPKPVPPRKRRSRATSRIWAESAEFAVCNEEIPCKIPCCREFSATVAIQLENPILFSMRRLLAPVSGSPCARRLHL